MHDDTIRRLLEVLENKSENSEEDCFFELLYLSGELKPVCLLQTGG
jgi:hypothetical protein